MTQPVRQRDPACLVFTARQFVQPDATQQNKQQDQPRRQDHNLGDVTRGSTRRLRTRQARLPVEITQQFSR
ncbi:hypothetical protein D3C76_1220090 [compost metagenome]